MESVPLGLPAAILPSVQAVLSPDATSQFVRVQPNNLSSIVSSATTVSASATVVSAISFPATPIQFSIPAGASPNVFIDHSKSSINFRVRYQVSTAATTNYTGTTATLQGSAHSWFERCTEMINGQIIDDQTGWDVACNSDLAWGLNVSDRDANAVALGLYAESSTDASGSFNRSTGHLIPAFTGTTLSAASNYFSYNIPYKSAFAGVDAKSFTPIGRCGKYDVTLYTPAVAPITILNSGAAAGAGAQVTITIDQINLELFYITLDQQSAALLPSMDKPWALSGITHRTGSGTLPASVSGAVSIQVPIRVKSARSLATRFSENSRTVATGAANGKFDSKAVLASSMSFFLAGQKRVPNLPHSTQFNLSRIFAHTQQAYYDKGIERWMSRCGYTMNDFAKYAESTTAPTAANQYDQMLVDAGAATVVTSLAGFEFAEDLRLASTSQFLNGSDLTSSNSFLEMNLLSGTSNQQNITFIAKADIIFVVMPNGNVEARV